MKDIGKILTKVLSPLGEDGGIAAAKLERDILTKTKELCEKAIDKAEAKCAWMTEDGIFLTEEDKAEILTELGLLDTEAKK